MEVSDRIRKVRGALKTWEFAKKIGVSKTTIQRWEKGEIVPKGEDLITISRLFGKNLHWLLTGDGDENLSDIRSSGLNQANNHTPANTYKERGRFFKREDIKNSEHISAPGARTAGDLKSAEAMMMAARVLDSETSYAYALYLNIIHFDRAIQAEARLTVLEQENRAQAARIKDLEAKVAALEQECALLRDQLKEITQRLGEKPKKQRAGG